jgi:soluble lytic murein transglycosylase-like protein
MKTFLIVCCLILFTLGGTSLQAAPQQSVPPAKKDDPGAAATVPQAASPSQAVAPVKKDDPGATAAARQASSIEAMRLSIEKQKAAIRSQIGEGGGGASFFTTPWVSPAIITPVQCDAMAEADLAPLVTEAALAEDLNAGLIRAVIRRESASFPCAVSVKGASGLMQLMPETAQQFGVDPFDPGQNVHAGAKYLKQLLTRYKGDTALALAAYNAGPGKVDEANGVPSIPETTAYVDAILKEIAQNNTSAAGDPKPSDSTAPSGIKP